MLYQLELQLFPYKSQGLLGGGGRERYAQRQGGRRGREGLGIVKEQLFLVS